MLTATHSPGIAALSIHPPMMGCALTNANRGFKDAFIENQILRIALTAAAALNARTTGI